MRLLWCVNHFFVNEIIEEVWCVNSFSASLLVLVYSNSESVSLSVSFCRTVVFI